MDAADEIHLHYDPEGFLRGRSTDLGAERAHLELLRAIKGDTGALLDVLSQQQALGEAPEPAPAETPIRQLASARRTTDERADPALRMLERAAGSLEGAAAALEGIAVDGTRVAGASSTNTAVADTVAPSLASKVVRLPPPAAPVAQAVRERDANGRFIGKGRPELVKASAGDAAGRARRIEEDPAKGNQDDRVRDNRRDGVLSRLAGVLDRMRGGVSEAAGGLEQVDPSIAAAKEAGGLLAPLTRPLMSVFGRLRPGAAQEAADTKVNVPWYRRMFGELREINKKTERKGALSKLLGGLGSLLGRLPLLGPLLGLLAGLLRGLGAVGTGAAAAAGGLARRLLGRKGRAERRAGRAQGRETRRERAQRRKSILQERRRRRLGRQQSAQQNADGSPASKGAGAAKGPDSPSATRHARAGRFGRAGRMLGGAGRLAGGLLRRIPLLGALLSGGMALSSIFGMGDQSREERFHGAGSGVGALVGGGIGTLLGGPVGAVIGGMLGDKIGGMVGDWLATVDWKDIGNQITGAWDGAVETVKSGWDWVQNKFSGALDTLSGWADRASDWMKEKGEQASKLVEQGKAYVQEKAQAVMEHPTVKQAVEAGGKVVDAVKEKAAPVVEAVTTKAGEVKEAAIVAGGRLAGKLDASYRHKESFEDVKGGGDLAKWGRYTNAEADRIRELKTSGANTSGRLKDGMPLEVRSKIIAAAKAEGLDPDAMLDMANIESGGNANAISSTGAIGVYQMTGGTASGLGITDRFDADQNIAGAMKLAKENAATLTRAGLAVNRDNLYMLHQLGPKAGVEIIKGAGEGKTMDQLSMSTQSAAGFNVGKGSKTAGEYLAANQQALDARLGKSPAASNVPASLKPLPAAVATTGAGKLPAIASVPPTSSVQVAPAPPPAPVKITSNDAAKETPPSIELPLGQNVRDRGLAQAATGGIGMGNR